MIQFKKIILHNFGCYDHAEIELTEKGFCLVSGKNNYKKDNAASNGSGKSFIWNAVCFTITGETTNGLKSNLKNINTDENSCYTELLFTVDGTDYEVKRIIAPKSDLKIKVDGEDISGKGIRESEKILGEYLPNLNRDLITSTIIIGQGMPNKFSSFSPSGRKELLEKLTNSDFMIEDIKARVAKRLEELNSQKVEKNNAKIALDSKNEILQSMINNLQYSLDHTEKPDYDAELSQITLELANCNKIISDSNILIPELTKKQDEINMQLLEISKEKSALESTEYQEYNTQYNNLNTSSMEFDFKIKSLTSEITKLKSITDTCPYCKQKLPNVEKPDTSNLEQELEALKNNKKELDAQISKLNAEHNLKLVNISSRFKADIDTLNLTLEDLRSTQLQSVNASRQAQNQASIMTTRQNKLLMEQASYDDKMAKMQVELNNNLIQVKTNNDNLSSINNEVINLDNHLAVVKKMETLIKRDFRGYLLTNIINYIDSKAKDFCEIVFKTRDLNVYLDGNALDISYCGKMFDNLSGGEKQRVDLILQFAIRDMLTTYFDLNANILVLDEITDFLDKQSCEAVMQLLEKELNSTESVFIVSHHADELELPIDSEIKIIKNTNGISEVY